MKKDSKKILEHKKELVSIFSRIKGGNEIAHFLTDILTPREFEALSQRWQIVKRLHKGETHRQIAGELGLGISTVTRGSRALRNKKGAFNLLLSKLNKEGISKV